MNHEKHDEVDADGIRYLYDRDDVILAINAHTLQEHHVRALRQAPGASRLGLSKVLKAQDHYDGRLDVGAKHRTSHHRHGARGESPLGPTRGLRESSARQVQRRLADDLPASLLPLPDPADDLPTGIYKEGMVRLVYQDQHEVYSDQFLSREREFLDSYDMSGYGYEKAATMVVDYILAVRTPPAHANKFQKRNGSKATKKLEQLQSVGHELNSAEATVFRALAARCNYLAQDKADMFFSAKELCRELAVPNKKS